MLLALSIGASAAGGSARAQDGAAERNRLFYATLYGDVFAHTDLYMLPLYAVEGRLVTAAVNYLGAGLGYAFVPSFSVPMPFCTCRINGLSLEVEGQIGRYFGLQHDYETDLALLLRSPQLPLFAGLSVNFAAGEGMSYAFTLPEYEGIVAAEGTGTAGPRRFLDYMAYEAELSAEQLKNWHVLFNVHHRSGIWGVIAPHRTGANYVGGGIRADF